MIAARPTPAASILFAARVIPYRGSWLDFEFDAKDIVNVRIDRKRKLPVTALLHALGLDDEEILNHFYNTVALAARRRRLAAALRRRTRGAARSRPSTSSMPSRAKWSSQRAPRSRPRAANKADKDGLKELLIPTEEIFGRYSAHDLIDEKHRRIYIEAGDEVSPENLDMLDKAGIDQLELLDIDHITTGPWIRNTLKADKSPDRDHALADIYRVMRPGEPPTRETAEALFEGLFFDADRYDLSAVGRVKLNMRLAARCRGHRHHAAHRGYPRGGQGAGQPQGRQGRRRRHRQPRQPPRPFGRRTARKPVPRRAAAHGARGQGADELGRCLDRDAQRPDQRQAGGGRGARVLRLDRSSRSSWTRPTRCPKSPTSAASRRSGRAV